MSGDANFSLPDRAEALRRSPALGGLPEATIEAIAGLLVLRRYEDLHPFDSRLQPEVGAPLRLIVQGSVLLHAPHDGGEPRRLLGPGDVFGVGGLLDHVLLGSGAPREWRPVWDCYAVEPCWVLELAKADFGRLDMVLQEPRVIELLRRAVDEPRGKNAGGVARTRPRVVLVLASEVVRASLPLRPLTFALAQTLCEHLGERVQVISLEPTQTDGGAANWLRVGVPADGPDSLMAFVAELLSRRLPHDVDVVLVDASALRLDPPSHRALARAIRALDARTLLSYLFATPEEWSRLPSELGAACVGDFVLPTVVLPPAAPVGVGRTLESMVTALDDWAGYGTQSFVDRLRELPSIATAQARRFAGVDREAIGAAARRQIHHDESARAMRPVWPRGAVRLRLSTAAREELRRRDGRLGLVADAWSPAAWVASAGGVGGDREGLERWSRALTGRRVGVAIGGSGALSYVGIPLLRGLRAAGIPVDMVSGTSFGAIVAAYYAAHGDEGLELIERHWYWAQLTVALGWISPRPVQWWIDNDLGFIDLADLEVPLIPVTTNAHNGHEWDIRAGLIGHACTASGSLPPLAPTHDGDTRLIDGALSSVVPSRALVEAGADMVVGANVVPHTRPRTNRSSKSWMGLARGLNPLTRAEDFARSYLMLFRQASLSQDRFTDVMYSAESPTGNGATFYKHRALIDHAERSPSLEQAVARAAARWQQLLDARSS